jgi:ribosomal protein L23
MRYFYIKITYITEKGSSSMDLGFKVDPVSNLNKNEIKKHIEQNFNVKIKSLFLNNIYEFKNRTEFEDFWE